MFFRLRVASSSLTNLKRCLMMTLSTTRSLIAWLRSQTRKCGLNMIYIK